MKEGLLVDNSPLATPPPLASIVQSDGSSQSDDDPTTSNHTHTDQASSSSKDGAVELSRNETKAVKRGKLVVYLVLALAAAAMGTVTYFLTSNEETDNYQKDFSSYAKEISRVAESNAKAVIGQVQSFSVTVTSIVVHNNFSWPNVSVPHFDRRAREAEALTGIELLLFVPIVPFDERDGWEEYAWENQGWINEDLQTLGALDVHPGNISRHIYSYSGNETIRFSEHGHRERHLQTAVDPDFYVPVWQLGPVPSNASIINLDLNTHPSFQRTIYDVLDEKHAMLSDVADLRFLLENALIYHDIDDHPRSYILQPIFEDFRNASSVAGFFVADIKWHNFFVNLLPDTKSGILVVVHGTCGGDFSYLINGPEAIFLKDKDVHNTKFDDMEQVFEFASYAKDKRHNTSCSYTMSVYPTESFEEPYHTNQPAIYASVVVLIFCLTTAVFALYDYMVLVRQRKLLATAQRTNAIVASMFPKTVQRRIMEEAAEHAPQSGKLQFQAFFPHGDVDGDAGQERFKSKPIADLFTDVTVMFADIVGFTAWSSMREPSQVFTLLETIFHEYDEIAKRRKVFKVETVGDCYVAVVGLPDPRKDHAVVMARFARDCLLRFNVIVKQLENTLGPDTSDLGMRFGLHSGPVTAGVLRGDRARFQLFGDTMNTAARIESTGARNKIHISCETAERLVTHGKSHWCIPRVDRVVAKGKGELTTYWLELKGDSAKSSRSGTSNESGEEDTEPKIAAQTIDHSVSPEDFMTNPQAPVKLSEKHQRLVNWNTEILCRILREAVARRETVGTTSNHEEVHRLEAELQRSHSIGLDEVKDVVCLPRFSYVSKERQVDPEKVELTTAVTQQLQDYVATIANLYRDNAFHNFEHASHVTMSVIKLLSRIIAPDIKCNDAKDLHDHTYGITSDPLTQFAVILSALVHDVDHTGVPNTQLVKEQAGIALVYKNKSVAEQNSIDIAWDLLQQDQFEDLRNVIYVNADEFQRFRQLLVNVVMATDIMDKELSNARKVRWSQAFAEASLPSEDVEPLTDRKATIVIEHMIQASDVAHTMQHWHIYRKWNTRLFEEMYRAFLDGRADKDPSETWYEGEIGFFDFYVIPLAKKLKDCGVFGVSSDEYLSYAQQNRREWESKGRQIVAEMVDRLTISKL